MKVYGPDITKDGNYTVKLFHGDDEKKVFLEFHTDNDKYANIYFDAITNVISHSDVVKIKHSLRWTKKSNLYEKYKDYLDNIKPKTLPEISEDLWVLYLRDNSKDLPKLPRYKYDLVKWVCNAKRWTKSKANKHGKVELRNMWLNIEYTEYRKNKGLLIT